MKFVVDDKIPFIQGQAERLADEVVYLPGAAIAPDDVRDADALVVRTRTLCNRQLLEGSRVRFIATATIGYDHLDTEYLDVAGIAWTNCPGCNATSVAQYVRNSLLQAERAGLIRLSEATLGVVGYGHVGRAVYEAVRPYVKEILVNDPPLAERLDRLDNLDSLESLATNCDIITLHTPLTTEGPFPTRHLVDEAFLRSLAKRPLIINAARGGVVDEEALLRAMDDGRVRQAIIDTWEGEPDIDRQLLSRVFIGTPHIAGYSADGKANATRMSLEALARWVKNEGLKVKDEARGFHISLPEAETGRTGLHYNPMDDSQMLKRAPQQFETLRGNYPLRRE